MAQFDTQYTAIDHPSPRRLWPLGGVFWIDLLIVIVLAVLIALAASTYVFVRAAQEGLVNLADGRSLERLAQDQETVNRLLGAGGAFVVLLIQNAILIGVPMLRVAVLRRGQLATIGFQAHAPLRLALFGVGLGVAVLAGNALLSYLFRSIGIEQNQAAQYPLFQGDYVGQALFLVGAAILAPIGEETFFRGYAFNALRQTFQTRRWGLPLAYLVSALLFMAAHALAATQGLSGLLVPAFLMGLALAWGMHRTGSLLPCVIAHALNNSVALLALLVCVNNPGIAECPRL